MPQVIFSKGSESRTVEAPQNATLLDALKLCDLPWTPLWNSRWRSWIGKGPAGGEPLVYILSGHEGLTPPSAYEVAKFADSAEKIRLASQAGLLPQAQLEVSLDAPTP